MSLTFSRRSFLKYTAVAAVAVAGSSLLTGCGDNPYQPVGAFGKELKIMGTFTAENPTYTGTTFACDMSIKCTSNNNLCVDNTVFQLTVTDTNGVEKNYTRNSITLSEEKYDLSKNDKAFTPTVTIKGVDIPEGATVEFLYFPRKYSSTGNNSLVRAYATWKGTYKNGKIE